MSYYVLIHMRPPMFVSDKDGNAAEFSTEGEAHDEAHSQTACLLEFLIEQAKILGWPV